MYYYIFPETDTTLYEASGSSNAGLDEILEIRKDMSKSGGNIKISRILIKFDLSEISASVVNGTITSPKYYLNMYDANSQNLSTSQSLYAYPISGSWLEGQGTFNDDPKTTEGAGWNYKDGLSDKTYWLSGSDSAVSSSGGAWYTSSYGSQSFAYETDDMIDWVILNSFLDKHIRYIHQN